MSNIGFVGAGAATAAAAFALESGHEGKTVTVLEKSGGLGGRAATRRCDGATYDYGANYLKADDELVVELLTETLDTEGLVDIGEPIYTFDAGGDVSEGRDADQHKWTFEQGLTQIAKRLFARTDATVHRNTPVTALHRAGDVWHVTDENDRRWGPFDVLLLNPPAPQSAALLENADWDAPLRNRLVEALVDVEFRTIWTALLHYPFRLDRPYYALVNADKSHDIGWISREECKRGHVPDGESLLVVQANHDWSVAHYDDPPADNVAHLAKMASEILSDDRLRTPDWTDCHGWRYAQPEESAPTDLLAQADAHDLYFLGDWTRGTPRLHAALRSGLDIGDRLGTSL
ncbi:MAG: FAD-dependent oxidoreductase [Halapricum sp.]